MKTKSDDILSILRPIYKTTFQSAYIDTFQMPKFRYFITNN